MGYELRKCGMAGCDYEFVGSDDAKMFRHIEEEHANELERAWWFGRMEAQA